jgi:uncharacterized protein
MLVYTDSCVLIYYLDQVGPFHQRATNRLAQISQSSGQIVVSDLVRLECRVKPLQLGDKARLAQFDGFFVSSNVIFAPMSSAVFDRATSIRATHGFKLADSLHLAAALESGCQMFLTNDGRLSTFTDIAIEVLP